MKTILYGLFQAIFWIWNLTFLVFVYLGILPYVGIPLIWATFDGLIPFQFFLTFAGLIAVPSICTLLALRKLRENPAQLVRLFYGVEAPLFLLLSIRLFVLRELTPASGFLIGTVLLCIFTFGLELFYGYAQNNRAIARWQLLAHSLILLIGIYGGCVLLFYTIPTSLVFLVAFFSFEWLRPLLQMLTSDPSLLFSWLPITFFLFALTSSLFLVMPFAVIGFYISSGRKIWRAFAAQFGRNKAWLGSVATATAWLLVFLSLQQQPQTQAFELLDRPAETNRDRQELLAKSDLIRDGLVNAYLSSYRYISTWDRNNHIREMYRNIFGMEKANAHVVQYLYNQFLSPFLYRGSRSDSERSEKLYADFFDAPIQKAERSAIERAIKSTFDRGQVKAGLLDINQEKVWIARQEIAVKERGDWADVELYELYENQTPESLETFYSFSLPESAVLTGIWLGESDNRDKRFRFQISPRGAAQQVYNDQVRRWRPIDPALLEQVGPRHYRLRVFPIPARLTSLPLGANSERQEQPKQHLWLTYKVMRQEEGWPLPQLGEKRNAFWTRKTELIYNGQEIERPKNAWLPEFVSPAESALEADSPDSAPESAPDSAPQFAPQLHEVNLPGNYRIVAKPLAAENYSLPQGERFAIILDTSRSMAANSEELEESFTWLQKVFAAKNDVDLYVTASAGAASQRIENIADFDRSQIVFYGGLQFQEMLQQFDRLRGNTSYDAILLVTDRGSYELSEDNQKLPAMPAPFWIVHLGGLPQAYDDATLKVIQYSRGGVSTNIQQALRRLATQADLDESIVSVVDGYAWFMESPGTPDFASLQKELQAVPQSAIASFDPLAVRQWILALTKNVDASQLADLDAIHAIAKRYEIVSPYSSAIVLVNDEQRQALKEAEEKDDRFEREVEDGKEQLSQPNDPFSVSVPEPKVWFGSILAIAFLIFLKRKQAKARV
ncbi:MAG: TIGR02921 family PEP-CTERM protein [Oscillatoria sp. SIO1A7]|nr:TIGR02921 family PEP-CTERM protein [Oscillatoria sp. SIO1A7]